MYKSASCLFLLYDPHKKWSFDYVKQELTEKVPKGMDVLVVANFKDDLENVVVSKCC